MNLPKYYLLASLLLMLSLNSCSQKPEFPSINYSASKDYNTGHVVWRDLVSPDPKVSADFYKKVFGWNAVKSGTDEEPYWIFKSNGKPVAGMYQMKESRKNAGGEWLPYFSSKSQNDLVKRSDSYGASQILKPVDISGRGKVSVIKDPSEAFFALITTVKGDPKSSEPEEFEFLWNELWSNNTEKSEDYYKKLFNFQSEKIIDDNREYIVLKFNDKPVSGIIKNPAENVRDHWVQYVKVSNVKDIEEKAKLAGAKIIIPNDIKIRKGTLAVFIDPTGAPVAIQKWPIE